MQCFVLVFYQKLFVIVFGHQMYQRTNFAFSHELIVFVACCVYSLSVNYVFCQTVLSCWWRRDISHAFYSFQRFLQLFYPDWFRSAQITHKFFSISYTFWSTFTSICLHLSIKTTTLCSNSDVNTNSCGMLQFWLLFNLVG